MWLSLIPPNFDTNVFLPFCSQSSCIISNLYLLHLPRSAAHTNWWYILRCQAIHNDDCTANWCARMYSLHDGHAPYSNASSFNPTPQSSHTYWEQRRHYKGLRQSYLPLNYIRLLCHFTHIRPDFTVASSFPLPHLSLRFCVYYAIQYNAMYTYS